MMRTRWLAGAVIVAIGTSAAALVAAQSMDRGAVMLEAAIQKELVDGDLTGAIAQYQEILKLFPDEHPVAAQALWHLGQCYEHRGDPRARSTYERLLLQHGDHTVAAAARGRLAALMDAPTAFEPSEATVREAWTRPPAAVTSGGMGMGNFVIFSDLAVHNVRTGESRRLTDAAHSSAYPVVSPDGRQVVYLSWSGDLQESLRQVRSGYAGVRAPAELRMVGMDGSGDRVLLRKDGVPWLRPFAWSPEGQHVLTVLERPDGVRQIALVDAKDSSIRVLRSLQSVSPQGMGFSPDGRYIAYEVPTPRNSRQLDFFLLPIENDEPIPLAERRYIVSQAGQRGVILSDDQRVIHVLNRVGFGPRLGDIERVKAIGIDAYIDQQLHPERIPDPIVDARLASFTSLNMTVPALLEKAGPVVLEGVRRRATLFELREMVDRSAQPKTDAPPVPAAANEPARPGTYSDRPADMEIHKARLIRAVYSGRQLQEVLVDFWMNHFNVNLGDHQLAPHFEQDAIRRHAFGMFEDLLLAVAKHPRMLFYLDNWRSSAPADVMQQRVATAKSTGTADQKLAIIERQPFLDGAKGLNENFGRELLELHTLGVDGGYTQQDVIAAAKILTGWTISGRGIINGREDDGAFAFDPTMHVDGDKVVLGQTFKAGGVNEGEQLLKMLAHHPSTARFIATKLTRRFIADDPPADVVAAASRTFQQTGGNIREVVRTILMSPQFRSADVYAAKIKKPLELVASSLRAVNAEATDEAFLQMFRNRTGILALMGEKLYNYEAPDGNPDVGAAWMNSNALLVRLDFANSLAMSKLTGVKINLGTAQVLLGQLGLPRPTAVQIEQTRKMMQASGAPAAAAGSMRGSMMMTPGSSAGPVAPPVDPAAIAVAAMLGSPQFQKR